jgi:LacI family transcriptional regulator
VKVSQPYIAIVFPACVPWMAECLRGIEHYACKAGGWQIVSSPPSLRSAGEQDVYLPQYKTWRGDGVIANLTSLKEVRIAAKMPMPVVNLSGWTPPGQGPPRVNADHVAIGRLAAEHLLSLGLRHFAYYGMEGPWYCRRREHGFLTRLAQAGFSCAVHRHEPGGKTPRRQYTQLTSWLSSLPKPVGILAVQDYRARIIIEFCARLGLAIPDDVAVLGVDNDPITCEYCVPSLSSVSRDPFACGVAAAALLDQLMKGLPPPAHDVLVAPEGVVQRRSTDRFYDDDPVVHRVAEYAAAHAGNTFSVSDMAGDLHMSRRLIELRFRARLGMTPLDYIHYKRVNRAKALLLDASRSWSLGEIASATGFGCTRALHRTFRELSGYTPTVYRERFAVLGAKSPSLEDGSKGPASVKKGAGPGISSKPAAREKRPARNWK